MARGLLLVNLGSPREPTTKAVGAYLTEFLTDPLVIDLPFLFRQILVRGVIVPFRSGKSAEQYRKIWTDKGSPLVQTTKMFAEKLQAEFGSHTEWSVRWAMRYGEPKISEALKNWDVNQIFLIPLYPQYAESSTRSSIEKVRSEALRLGLRTPIGVLDDFYEAPEFIESEIRQIQSYLHSFKPDEILLSFHGLPEHHLHKQYPEHCLKENCCTRVSQTNRYCYRAQCHATAKAIIQRLNFPADKISIGFQSRLGRRPWIKPYTDHVISDLAKKGVRRLLVSCPSFVTDCLETLEEVQFRLRDQFLSEGGQDLQLVPALNADVSWVKAFRHMVERVTRA